MILGFIGAGLGLLFGLGGLGSRSFEQSAANEIHTRLRGPNSKVSIQTRAVGLNGLVGDFKRVTISASEFSTPGLPLFTEPQLSKKGKIGELRIDLTNFDLGNLHILSLHSSIPDCRFDFGLALRKRRMRLSRSGTGSGNVTIQDKDLERFILRKFHEIKTVRVKISGGKIDVEGVGDFLIIHTAFSVQANLTPLNGSQLVLSDAVIMFDGHPADEFSRQALLKTLNPVVDLNRDLKLYGAIDVSEVKLGNGVLEASGNTQIPLDPNVK